MADLADGGALIEQLRNQVWQARILTHERHTGQHGGPAGISPRLDGEFCQHLIGQKVGPRMRGLQVKTYLAIAHCGVPI
ncbi:hypothetical protein D3C79_1028010 [compost metagenome]